MIALIAGPTKAPRFAQGLGLPYLAAVLEATGFKVRIFDLYPTSPDTDEPMVLDQRLADTIAQAQPTIVGMTIHTPDYAERVQLARFLRERLPNTLFVAGGHHPSVEPADLLQHSDFDVCVIGEGEETLREVAQYFVLCGGRGRFDWLRDIPGLVYKQGDEVIYNPLRPPVSDVDSLPFPAHHLLGLEHYAPHPILDIQSTSILTYRGCPMHCAFCLNPQGQRVRRRSPPKVADEMERVTHEFGVRGFIFYDNLFGYNREHTVGVCEEIIRRRMDVVWDCWTAGDLIDTGLAAKMKAAGCIRVGFGAESGDDQVLFRAQRGFTTTQHQTGIHALRASGLKVSVFFMIGLPGESEQSVRRTVDLAKRCGADEVCLSLHRPYPGTAIWQNPEAFSVRITRGPNFEAYLETENLSRSALLECAQWASEELKRCGLIRGDFLRYDRYAWE
jgi:anaerobic magnesium-protoporphyrin IX monomethyl ester cyclase